MLLAVERTLLTFYFILWCVIYFCMWPIDTIWLSPGYLHLHSARVYLFYLLQNVILRKLSLDLQSVLDLYFTTIHYVMFALFHQTCGTVWHTEKILLWVPYINFVNSDRYYIDVIFWRLRKEKRMKCFKYHVYIPMLMSCSSRVKCVETLYL